MPIQYDKEANESLLHLKERLEVLLSSPFVNPSLKKKIDLKLNNIQIYILKLFIRSLKKKT